MFFSSWLRKKQKAPSPQDPEPSGSSLAARDQIFAALAREEGLDDVSRRRQSTAGPMPDSFWKVNPQEILRLNVKVNVRFLR